MISRTIAQCLKSRAMHNNCRILMFSSSKRQLRKKMKEFNQKGSAAQMKIEEDKRIKLEKSNSFAQFFAISQEFQMSLLCIPLIPAIFFFNTPFNPYFYYSLYFGSKVTSLVLLANISLTNHKLTNSILFVSIVGLEVLVPINDISGIGVQIFQYLVFLGLSNMGDSKTNKNMNDTLLKSQVNRMKIRISLFLSLTAIICLKLSYFFNCEQTKNQIDTYNQQSKQMASKAL